jgi:hypothetical protein
LSFKSSYISIASENKKVGESPLQQTTFSDGWQFSYHMQTGNASNIYRPDGACGRTDKIAGLSPSPARFGFREAA